MHTFQVDGLSNELRVMRFEGREGVSELFHFDVLVSCPDNDIAFADVVGQSAVLTFRVGDEPRHVHGIVSSFEEGEEGKKLTAYHLTVVPTIWRLLHRRNSRIFQELTTPDILKKVLDKAGIADYKLMLNKSETVNAISDESVAKNKSTTVGENYVIEVSKDMSVMVAKNLKEETKEERTIIVGKKLSVQCGDATITIEKNGNITVQGKKIMVKGDGPIEVEGKKLMVKSVGAVNLEASWKVVIKGSNVGVN